jgi:hypothetical protein
MSNESPYSYEVASVWFKFCDNKKPLTFREMRKGKLGLQDVTISEIFRALASFRDGEGLVARPRKSGRLEYLYSFYLDEKEKEKARNGQGEWRYVGRNNRSAMQLVAGS